MSEQITAVGLLADASISAGRASEIWGELITCLYDQGAATILIRSDTTYSAEAGFSQGIRLGAGNEDSTEVTGFHVGSLRDYTGRNGHSAIPSLNNTAVIDIAQNKDQFYSLFAANTALTFVADRLNSSGLSDFLHSLPGATAVLKPVIGHNAIGVSLGPKEVILQTALDRLKESGGRIIVQETLDTSHLAPGIRGINPAEDEKLAAGYDSYGLRQFFTNGHFVPVMRVNENGPIMRDDSFYIFIDPESVPAAAYDLARTITHGLSLETGVTEIHGALDMVYHPLTGEWLVEEFNVKEPGLPNRSGNAYIAHCIKTNLATQLIRMAGSSMDRS